MDNYLQIDFESAKESLKELLKNSNTFRDYNYEGANITMLLELMSYVTELSTYYNNKLAKNIYPESAEIYETMHSIASIRGYSPKGYIAPFLDLTVDVGVTQDNITPLASPGDVLYIPAWFVMETDSKVKYTTTDDHYITVPDTTEDNYSFEIILKQGSPKSYEFQGPDVINNKLLLTNETFDYNLYLYEENPSMMLYVNGERWKRVANFEDDISLLNDEDNIYMLEFDKYQRYNIVFSSSHNVPNKQMDRIVLIINVTDALKGSVRSYVINNDSIEDNKPTMSYNNITNRPERINKNFIRNITKDINIDTKFFSVYNKQSSYNGALPETIEDVNYNSKNLMWTQFRNVNSDDYKEHIEQHPNVVKGRIWGEKEQGLGNLNYYNKTYISVIPSKWGNSTINIDYIPWQRETFDNPAWIYIPTQDLYEEGNETFKQSLFTHLERRKFLNTYEVFMLPELVWFAFDIGVKARRGFNYEQVKNEVKEKLKFYFKSKNRNFNEVIDFKNIYKFILNTNIWDDKYTFPLIKGIQNLIFRDVHTYVPTIYPDTPDTIYGFNNDKYPRYTVEEYSLDFDNIIRPIELGFNQFPMLSAENCLFINEGK